MVVRHSFLDEVSREVEFVCMALWCDGAILEVSAGPVRSLAPL